MSARNAKRAQPALRHPAKSDPDHVLRRAASISVLFTGFLVLLFALHAGRFFLAPVTLAIVVGLMLSPFAERLEKRVPPTISAAAAVALFLLIVGLLSAAIAAPLSSWAGQVPQIWNELQLQLSSFSEPLNTFKSVREQIRSVTGEAGLTVSVEDGSAVESMAVLAPALLAQIVVFLASLYFFIATRHQTRLMVLKLCTGRPLRRRTAHIFRDVEYLVSNYLLAITVINAGLGLAVGVALWLAGVPSAPLWGALAGILNFIIYIGPAIMAVILFGVGLASFETLWGSLIPPLIYLTLNGIEAQFVTPLVIGRRMTLNPFLVFLAVTFWIWLWGPVGGFIAIPALLVLFAVARNLLPGFEWALSEERRRQYSRLP
ncbi:AI-2E family transporter [Chelativorans sp. Marseille-P2723]|uniref:AI-2E family transporter n=1 Tax=Chelativorans sp. Marseille-P2723 TaxID=2709133 RepID=UPI00156E5F92|nr:AI-2E family transporter [Chelativorans sp. Marseille-P2723]